VQSELEAGHDSKIAATAADRPEEVGICIGIYVEYLTICGHNFRREQIVNGQPVLSDKVTNTASSRESADSHRARIPKPGRKTVSCRGSCVFASSQTCLRPGSLPFYIDL
jgi:hypothetical protein